MATYATSLINVLRFYDFKGYFSDTIDNQRQTEFFAWFTNPTKYVIRGLDVSFNSPTDLLITKGAAVVDRELIVVDNDVIIGAGPYTTTNLMIVLEFTHLQPPPVQPAVIKVIDIADFNSANMLVLAVLFNGSIYYYWKPTDPPAAVFPEQRIQFNIIGLNFNRVDYTVTTTGLSTIPLLISHVPDGKKFFLEYNGILFEEGIDYTLNNHAGTITLLGMTTLNGDLVTQRVF